MNKSSYIEKSMPHYTLDQWRSTEGNIQKVSHAIEMTGDHVRQVGDKIRNATANNVCWKLRETNARLSDRIDEVDQSYSDLERTLEDVKDQIQHLSDAKGALERSLRDFVLLCENVKEVIGLRDRRRSVDVVEDVPYVHLKKELKLIECASVTLSNLSMEALTMLLALKDQRDHLGRDLKNKERNISTDKFALLLDPDSKDQISYKPNPLFIPESSKDVAFWRNKCKQRKQTSTNLCIRAMQLTNNIWGKVKMNSDEINRQRLETQRVLRQRHLKTLQARDVLGAQRKDLTDETERLTSEMLEIEASIRAKIPNEKLLHTRLENRKWRPSPELTSDPAHASLRDEFNVLMKARETLTQQQKDATHTLNQLKHQLRRVEEDLENKERSLAIEKTSLDAHSRIPAAAYETDIGWRAPATSLDFSLHPEKYASFLENDCPGEEISIPREYKERDDIIGGGGGDGLLRE